MDPSGYILLIVVAACVVALIYIARKQKALDEPVEIKSAVSSSTKASTSTVDKTTKKTEEKPSGPPQKTIYAFNAKSATCRCPFCDGENSVGAKVCNICGLDL